MVKYGVFSVSLRVQHLKIASFLDLIFITFGESILKTLLPIVVKTALETEKLPGQAQL